MKTVKKVLVVMLSVLMLFTVISVSASAEKATPDTTVITEGVEGSLTALQKILNEVRQILATVKVFLQHIFGMESTIDLYDMEDMAMARDGDTIKLAANINTDKMRITKDLDIDLNGHTLNCNEFTVQGDKAGDVNIIDGSINSKTVVRISAPDQTVTIENTDIVSNGTVDITAANLVIKDNDCAHIDCDRFIYNSEAANEVKFGDAAITGTTSVDILVPNGTLNISDTEIVSDGIVTLKAAEVAVDDAVIGCDKFIFNSETVNEIEFGNAAISGKALVDILVPNGTLNLSDIDVISDGAISLDGSMNTINIGENITFTNTLGEKVLPTILDNTRVCLSAETAFTQSDFTVGNNVKFDIAYSEENADKQVFTVDGGKITGLTAYGKTLSEITVPDMINGNAITEIGVGAFSLVDIATVPTVLTDEMSQIQSVKLPDTVEKIDDFAFYFNKGIVNFEFPASLKELGNSAFMACSSLSAVVLPDGFKTVGAKAFYSCRGITNLYLPEGTESIGNSAFNYNRGLTSVVIPSTVVSMGSGCFANCSSLKEADMKNSPKVIPANFMQACPLENLELPESVTYIGQYAFANAFTADAIILIPDGVETIDNCAFSAALMNTFVFADTVTELGNKVLFNCPNLTYVQFGSGLASMGTQMFRGCGKLEQVDFSEDAPLSEIPYQSFYGCSRLKTVNITRNITAIGTDAFRSCTGLQAPFFIPSSVTSIGSNAFRSVPTAIFHCEATSRPAGWVDAWSAKNILWGQSA